MHKSRLKSQTEFRRQNPPRYRTREPATRHLSDGTIKEFVEHLKKYAADNKLGRPTLLFAQTPHHFGVCLKWPDDQRAFSLLKGGWTADDYGKLCDLLRGAW